MKKLIISLFLTLTTLLQGCFSYKDINKLLFVTAVVVDIDKDKKPVIYAEAFKPFRSTTAASEKGQRIIFKGTGKTLYEALRDIHLSSSYKLNYTQYKAVVFTERAAAYGIDKWIDIFDRDQDFIVRPYIAITNESAEDLLNVKMKEEEYLGILLKELIDNEGASVRSVRLSLNEYLTKRLMGKETDVITWIGIKKQQPQDRIEIKGGGIVKDDKLVEFLPRDDGEGFNLLMNTLKTGSLEVTNPQKTDEFISLNILKNKTKTSLTYDGTTVHLRKTINVKVNIEEIDKEGTITTETLNKLKMNSEYNIKRACMRVFEDYKEKDLDIFDIQQDFERRYPRIKLNNVLKITELEVIVDENIEGSPDVQDFWD